MLFFRFIFTTLFFIPLTQSVLEDDILYDIKWQPELTPPLDFLNTYTFTSKRKEGYSCVLPVSQTTDTILPETILFSELEPFFEVIHSQAKTTCTYRLDPYWTYELCHGLQIRQYHETKVGGKRAVVQEYTLGTHHSEDQNRLVNQDNQQLVKIHYKTIENRQVPMLPVRYTHGTACEINSNQPRETLVLYMCHEKGNNAIINFHEVSSCYYEMTIASPQLCQILAFKLAEHNRYTINCYPQVNAPQVPKNLKRLEDEHEQSTKRGDGAQFTLTNADGSTFIISFTYANEETIKALTNNINAETINTVTPSTVPELEQQQQPQQPPSTISDNDFLKRFLTGQECLSSGSGWWKYEICYGKHALQFHDEGQTRTSVLLGTWNREKHIEWVNANQEKKTNKNKKGQQYISMYYTGGDMCELTNQPRVVEVKLKCVTRKDNSQMVTMYLIEPQTCSYILGVENPLFCNLIDNTDEYGIPDQEKLFAHIEGQ